ncbi:hypothetical protein CONCODRAFT_96430 [Conidiobolus coronatus NRRL 28638]|uniref:26S proteasome complex subunit SEM1 n=1 Tax=Conidiobolus coronatus (strain ATCC 28846 / CBS 209.66 / NRRL 28638) TaxID=796925 RepID=A0A137PG75_CONC2|nr:hypothetical protein CONCODRAFT_96430 [Conidiobolus coronatus NRRL 28638]|eukprot:KXN73992.1 hypothetical protein CONCODRAFT_96430 [Conidiobolus coronatus NRRL 28638]
MPTNNNNSTTDKQKPTETKPEAQKEQTKNTNLGVLEDDDEFEEFPSNLWDDNWDDDDIEDDFSKQLKEELAKADNKMQS